MTRMVLIGSLLAFFSALLLFGHTIFGFFISLSSIAALGWVFARSLWKMLYGYVCDNAFPAKKYMFECCASFISLGMMCAILYTFEPFTEQIVQYPETRAVFREQGVCRMDAVKTLAEIDQGKTNVFACKGAEMDLSSHMTWKQSDFLRVVKAFYRFQWQDDLAEWKLAEVGMSTSCNDVQGMRSADFLFYKTIVTTRWKILYTAREIQIDLSKQTITWKGSANFPHPVFLGWQSVNLLKVPSAEDALAYAEEKGGREVRTRVNNRCAIRMYLTGGRGWVVQYYGDGGPVLLEVSLDS